MQSTVRTTVSDPIDAVWKVLADHEGLSDWGPGISASLTTPGRAEPNGVGAVRRISTPLPAPAIVEEVTTFEPGRRLSYKALSGVPLRNYRCDVVLEEAGGGTAISYTVLADQRVPLVEKALTKVIAAGLLNGLVRAVRKAD
ncbi:SRPBCC family protein [Nocardioides bizhenqiangii]|uniref:SRPBCC family protein n=1 Tax=Nocardioides bizhenqiangii TaxID=3095076 RepID=A0ABZ0ZQD9_9ACTN|nr:SRPBCC family protein [Nocardioides sp. HM61]WQQ26555.1 SRPBCC family protein [Nocardioides sp. HM61]